jgi:hypothetical protein
MYKSGMFRLSFLLIKNPVDGRPFTFISQGPDKWDRTTYTVLPSGSPIIFLLPPPIPQSLLNPDCIPIEVVHLAPAMTGPWFQRQLASLLHLFFCRAKVFFGEFLAGSSWWRIGSLSYLESKGNSVVEVGSGQLEYWILLSCSRCYIFLVPSSGAP